MTDRRHIEDIYPLTPMQQGMLFHALYAPDSGVYVQQVSARLKGGLDPVRFRRAWQALVDRHPVLRTGFEWERRADPFQVVYRQAELPWREENWTGDSEAAQSRRLDALLASDRAAGFALGRAPLMRVTLVRLAPDRWQLVWTHHHLILDGWSVPLLLQDLFALYRTGSADALEPRRPFRDHVAFVRAQPAEAARAFWTAELAGLDAPPPLPSAARDIAGRGLAGALEHVSIHLAARETDALTAFARERGLTLSTIVQGAWAMVVGAFSGAREALFGATVSGRPAALDGAERMVGLFINTLPVRVTLPDDAAVAPWLRALQDRLARQRDFEHTPLVDILGWSGLGREREPLESLFVFENYPVDPSVADGVAGLAIERADAHEQTNFPLTLVAVPGRELLLKLDFDGGRFDPAFAARVLDALRFVLHQLPTSADRPLGALAVTAPAERDRAIAEWNATRRAWPDDRLVHELVDLAAAADPAAIALRDDSGIVTFGDLVRRASAVAAGLSARGIGLERRVGVALPRSADLVVSLLGILKAGAAYVPLDPSHPAARLTFLATDAKVDLVVGGESAREALGGTTTLVALDDLERAGSSSAPVHVSPHALAYVLYTSGSTGTPKGVMITHRGLANYVRWAAASYDAAGGNGAPLHSPLGFDLTVTSLFPPLVSGRPIRIVADGERLDGLAAALRGSPGFSLVKITPAHLDALRDLVPREEAAGATRAFVIGGEALAHEALEFWREHAPLTRLVNEYGPTETVVGCAVYDAAPDAGARGPVPIGRPIANTRLYVLGHGLDPAPIGSPGELYIAGDGVARGYQGRSDLTAERFLPDPFALEPGARMYRSGDVARWRADGVLEFLGRADDQVKVRGYRIEPGEVEAALLAHTAVREAAVVSRKTSAGDAQLAAFVVLDGPVDADLRAFVRQRLPEHLVPAVIVSIDRLPLTPNGKIDRRSLAARALAEAAPRAYDAPRGLTEELLAALWADVLGRDRIGRDDNFFELGGHSLVATRLVARIRKAFGEDVPLKDIFEAPTVAALAARIGRIAGAASSDGEIEPRPIGEPPVLSFAQRRLWFLHELDPESPAYLVPAALRVDGALDLEAFRTALRGVVDRHESLRTRISTADGQPVVSIATSLDTPLTVVDLSGRPDADRDAELARLAALDASRPFDLARPPLLRATLVRLADARHVLLLTMHHLASDAWSMDVLVRDIAASYEAARQSRPLSLPALPVQYADVARWQRARLTGAGAAPLVDYWKARLDGVPALELPADRPRPSAPRLDGASVSFPLDRAAADGLVRLARAENATPFMAFLAAFEILLARYSGQDDFAVGTPVAGRARPETEHLVGFFMNTLALRADVAGAASFVDLLRRVRKTTIEAYAHQELPFERLVDLVRASRDLGHNPVVQTMFTLQHAAAPLDLPGLRLSPLALETTTSKFDVSLSIAETNGGWLATFEYRTDLFEAATLQRMARHFARLVEAAARAPEQPLDAVAMLDAGERSRAEAIARGPAVDGEAPLVHAAFEAQAAATPGAIALMAGDESLTFDALNRRANRFARRLVEQGVGADTIVALRLERSVDFVVSMLAVLKAGGAYAPIDPSYPADRIALMIEDAGHPLVVTHESLAGPLPHDDSNLPPRAVANSIAYVIFTSGSTGRPKGVMIPHRALANHMRWMQRVYPLAAGDRVLQKTPASFDASVWEFHAPLVSGATLVLARPDGHQDPEYLVRTIADRQVTILQVVPSLLRLLLDTDGFDRLASLRRVFAGGEALTGDLQERFFASSRAELVNLYGPTEVTIDSVAWNCRRGERLARVPIGLPVDNVSAHVLDARLEPAADGVVGELYLGGAGVGRGYLGRPDLTAERFFPDPFSETPGATLYRTGDRVRRRPSGELDYLGRADGQVKLRGFRVELGEIERAIESHASVRQAAVILRATASRQQLVAYVVSREGRAIDVAAVRAFVRARLPDYMVPAAFVALERLPALPNGKLDRRALPEPPAVRGDESAYLAPRNDRETALAAIWAEILGTPRVGVRDNFFSLGGDSILSLQVVARARKAGLTLTPAQMFTHQTVEALAAAASDAPAAAAAGAGVQAGDEVRLTPVERWFFDLPLPNRHHWNQAMLLKAPPAVDRAALDLALGDLVAHHDALRLRFRRDRDTWRQDYGPIEAPRVEVVDLSRDASPADALGREIARVQRSLDLARPPLVRVAWFDYGPARPGRLLIVAHHLVVDGVSWRILLDDLRAAYERRVAGAAPSLEPSTSFHAWSAQATALAASPALRDELPFWRRQLDAAAAAIPIDFADGLDANVEGSSRHVDATLPPDRTEALLRAVPPVYNTQVGDVLLAALVDALAPWTGRRQLTIELEGHGRDATDLDVSRTIGWFTTLYPVRLDAGDATGAGPLIRAVKEQLRAVPRKGIGFGLLRYLVDDDAVRRDLAARPSPSSSFNYLGQWPSAGGADAFGGAPEEAGPMRSPDAPRTHLLEIVAGVVDGRLRVRWTYSERVHRRETIARLADAYQRSLDQLIDHCLQTGPGGYTPSDFTAADLDQRELDKLLARLRGS